MVLKGLSYEKIYYRILIFTFCVQTSFGATYKVKDKYGRTVEKRVENKSGYKSYNKYGRYEGNTEIKNGEIKESDKYGRRK